VSAVLAAALAGLAGVAIGRLWDARSEAARWRRDNKVQTYQAMAAEFYNYREVIREVSVSERDPSGFSEQVERLWRSHAVWNQRLSAVWLHGSEKAAVAAYELDHALAEVGEWVIDHPVPEGEWPGRKEPVEKRFDDYIDAVRRDLSLPALGIRRARAADRVSQ
jgi:hypothetical protein